MPATGPVDESSRGFAQSQGEVQKTGKFQGQVVKQVASDEQSVKMAISILKKEMASAGADQIKTIKNKIDQFIQSIDPKILGKVSLSITELMQFYQDKKSEATKESSPLSRAASNYSKLPKTAKNGKNEPTAYGSMPKAKTNYGSVPGRKPRVNYETLPPNKINYGKLPQEKKTGVKPPRNTEVRNQLAKLSEWSDKVEAKIASLKSLITNDDVPGKSYKIKQEDVPFVTKAFHDIETAINKDIGKENISKSLQSQLDELRKILNEKLR